MKTLLASVIALFAVAAGVLAARRYFPSQQAGKLNSTADSLEQAFDFARAKASDWVGDDPSPEVHL
jgi:hypothetical protein